MIKIRLDDWKAGIALGCSWAIATTASAQIVVQGVPLNAPTNSSVAPLKLSLPTSGTQHLGSGPIDMNNLPADVLNCDVCRQRLGLPPLSKSAAVPANTSPSKASLPSNANASTPSKSPIAKPQQPETPPVPMLGSPGLISSATASQMAALGQVVEEFKPPQPQSDAIQLGEIPPEVRQQFLKSIDLPAGARVMSAEIKGKQVDATAVVADAQVQISSEPLSIAESTVAKSTVAESIQPTKTEHETLPQASVAKAPLETEKVINAVSPAAELAAEYAKKQADLERSFAEKMAALNAERDTFTKERAKMKSQLDQMQSEWLKRMAQADAANREALTMLEKRTAEMTELQMQVNGLKEALAKAKAGTKE